MNEALLLAGTILISLVQYIYLSYVKQENACKKFGRGDDPLGWKELDFENM
jgi:hypothetical protein